MADEEREFNFSTAAKDTRRSTELHSPERTNTHWFISDIKTLNVTDHFKDGEKRPVSSKDNKRYNNVYLFIDSPVATGATHTLLLFLPGQLLAVFHT